MKKMKLVFSFLEKVYWIGFGVTLAGAVFAISMFAWLANFVSQRTGPEVGFLEGMYEYAVQNNDSLGQIIFSPSGFSRTTLRIVIAIVVAFLHAKTFTQLHRFIKSKMNNLSLAEQRKNLWSIPKYIVAIYCLDIFLAINRLPQFAAPKADMSKLPEWAQSATAMTDIIFPKLFPSLGSPLGLIFALLIYFYCQSLQQTESLSQEAQKLREEADLVI